jgi:hypothetical protein
LFSSWAGINDGLVAYYPLYGNANDASGNGHHGTISGDVTFAADRFGSSISAASFDGNNDFITIPHDSSLNSSDGKWSAWVNLTKTGVWHLVIDKDTYGWNQDGHLQIEPDMSIGFWLKYSIDGGYKTAMSVPNMFNIIGVTLLQRGEPKG